MFDPIEAVGWAAACLTFAAYAMKTMLPLRVIAIGANLCFIVYSAIAQIYPTLVLHLALLPFNSFRLWQILALRGRLRAARHAGAGDFALMRQAAPPRELPAGARIFARGEAPDRVYYIAAGEVMLEELGVTLGAGEVLGEIAFFTGARERTATACCLTAVRLHALDEAAFLRLYFQHPAFGMAIMRLIAGRLAAHTAGPGGR